VQINGNISNALILVRKFHGKKKNKFGKEKFTVTSNHFYSSLSTFTIFTAHVLLAQEIFSTYVFVQHQSRIAASSNLKNLSLREKKISWTIFERITV
jgi:hypothetical protein